MESYVFLDINPLNQALSVLPLKGVFQTTLLSKEKCRVHNIFLQQPETHISHLNINLSSCLENTRREPGLQFTSTNPVTLLLRVSTGTLNHFAASLRLIIASSSSPSLSLLPLLASLVHFLRVLLAILLNHV